MISESRLKAKPPGRIGATIKIGLLSSAIAMPSLLHSATFLTAMTFTTATAEVQTFRERFKDRIRARAGGQTIAGSSQSKSLQEQSIAGLKVATWMPNDFQFFNATISSGIAHQCEFVKRTRFDILRQIFWKGTRHSPSLSPNK